MSKPSNSEGKIERRGRQRDLKPSPGRTELPSLTRKASWIRHLWSLNSICLIRHFHSYPPLLKLWWWEPLCTSYTSKPSLTGRQDQSQSQTGLVEPTPEAGVSPHPWSTKHQFSNRHWHSTTSFTHLPSQRPLPQAENGASRQRAELGRCLVCLF